MIEGILSIKDLQLKLYCWSTWEETVYTLCVSGLPNAEPLLKNWYKFTAALFTWHVKVMRFPSTSSEGDTVSWGASGASEEQTRSSGQTLPCSGFCVYSLSILCWHFNLVLKLFFCVFFIWPYWGYIWFFKIGPLRIGCFDNNCDNL